MGSTNDPGDYERRYKREKQKIRRLGTEPDDPDDEDDIDTYYDRPEDEAAVRAWANSLTQALSTRGGYIRIVRTFAERAALTDRPPVTEMTKADFLEFIDALETGDPTIAEADPQYPPDGLKYGTLRNIRIQMRAFFRDELGRDWAEDIDPGPPQETHITEDDIHTPEETNAILDAADPQETALISTLLATGLRIGAVHSLRVGDISVESAGKTSLVWATIRPEVIGRKDMAGRRPLTWAGPFVQNWLGGHPRRDEADAPLFCAKQGGENKYGTWERGDHVERRTIYRWLDALGDRAEDTLGHRPRMNPHTFRHTAITRLSQQFETETELKEFVGWRKDSSQLSRYIHIRAAEMEAKWLDSFGLDTEKAPPSVELDECPNPQCRAPLSDFAAPQACPACGLPLTIGGADKLSDARATAERLHEEATDRAIDATDPDERDAHKTVRESTADTDAVTARLAELQAELDELKADATE